jgi:hypothetical protein
MRDSKFIQGTTLLQITENLLEDGSYTYDIDIDTIDLHIPTMAMNSPEALKMAQDIATSLNAATGMVFHVTWAFNY